MPKCFYRASLYFLSNRLLSRISLNVFNLIQWHLFTISRFATTKRTHKKSPSSFKLRIGKRHAIQITNMYFCCFQWSYVIRCFISMWRYIQESTSFFSLLKRFWRAKSSAWNSSNECWNRILGHVRNYPNALLVCGLSVSNKKFFFFSIEFISECALAEYLTYTQLFRIYFAHFCFVIHIVKYISLITVYYYYCLRDRLFMWMI